jgi:hypothetical protein
LGKFPNIVSSVLNLLPVYEESFEGNVTQVDAWIDKMAMLLPKHKNNQADRFIHSSLFEKFRLCYYFGKKVFFYTMKLIIFRD